MFIWYHISISYANSLHTVSLFIVFLPHINCPVGWGCRTLRLLLWRGVRLPQRVSWYDTIRSHGEIPVIWEIRGIRSTLSLTSLPGPLWLGVVASDRIIYMGQIDVNRVLMLKIIAWNWTALTSKLHTSAKLNCSKWNCYCMLNWIVWNRNVFDIETVHGPGVVEPDRVLSMGQIELNCVRILNWIVWNRTVLTC